MVLRQLDEIGQRAAGRVQARYPHCELTFFCGIREEGQPWAGLIVCAADNRILPCELLGIDSIMQAPVGSAEAALREQMETILESLNVRQS